MSNNQHVIVRNFVFLFPSMNDKKIEYLHLVILMMTMMVVVQLESFFPFHYSFYLFLIVFIFFFRFFSFLFLFKSLTRSFIVTSLLLHNLLTLIPYNNEIFFHLQQSLTHRLMKIHNSLLLLHR